MMGALKAPAHRQHAARIDQAPRKLNNLIRLNIGDRRGPVASLGCWSYVPSR